MVKYLHCPNCGDESLRKIFGHEAVITDIGWLEQMLLVMMVDNTPKCKKCGAELSVIEKEG